MSSVLEGSQHNKRFEGVLSLLPDGFELVYQSSTSKSIATGIETSIRPSRPQIEALAYVTTNPPTDKIQDLNQRARSLLDCTSPVSHNRANHSGRSYNPPKLHEGRLTPTMNNPTTQIGYETTRRLHVSGAADPFIHRPDGLILPYLSIEDYGVALNLESALNTVPPLTEYSEGAANAEVIELLTRTYRKHIESLSKVIANHSISRLRIILFPTEILACVYAERARRYNENPKADLLFGPLDIPLVGPFIDGFIYQDYLKGSVDLLEKYFPQKTKDTLIN